MAPPPDAHDNTSHSAVYGQLVQARDIHGGVTINAPAQAAPAAPVADVSLDPPRLATAVRGRDALLAELGAAMKAGAPVPHVLTGPGGFGKTTVAAALAERARADGWTVFWIRPGSVAASMLEAAVELGGSREEAEQVRPTRHQAARWVWRHLDNASRPWLLVIDNADRPEELDPENRPGDQLGWMRSSPGGFVLVTSRVDDPAQWAPARVHRIGELDGAAATTALTDHAALTELDGARELAERLGGVPLALFLAGRILATHRVLFPDAQALLAKLDQDMSALDRLAAPLVTGGEAERGLLFTTWELSLRLVSDKDPHAAPLLRLLAVLGPDATDIPLRRLPVSELGDGTLGGLDEAAFARTINTLVVHGLVTVTTHQGDTALSLHPLVSETLRSTMNEAESPVLLTAETLLDRLRGRDPSLEAAAYAQISMVWRRTAEEGVSTPLRLFTKAARSLVSAGTPSLAEAQLRSRITADSGILGDTHPELLHARHTLADTVRAQDRIEEAEEIYRSVANKRAAVLGLDHPDTLSSRHQVALMAFLKGDLHTAEEGLRAVWDAYERLGSQDSPTALFALGNLAHVQRSQGDLDAAEKGFRRVRGPRARELGEEHPDTLVVDFNLAQVAFERGDHTAAMHGFERVARIRASVLGEDHPQTALAHEWRERAERRLRED
jgi:hypothetical protein